MVTKISILTPFLLGVNKISRILALIVISIVAYVF